MKKTLIAIVLFAFCFSVPVFASTGETGTPAAELSLARSNVNVPVFAQLGRHRRIRRRRIILRRRYRHAFRRRHFIMRHRIMRHRR